MKKTLILLSSLLAFSCMTAQATIYTCLLYTSVITDNARMKVLGGHETVYCDSCHRILH